ncbi:MAG: GDYXXLXY domain-containing protein [Novosphingobium sp.]
MTRSALLRAAALALPLLGLGWTWLSADQLSRQGTDWQVAVRGYDPHDILRGHYVQFTYDWPGLVRREDYTPLMAICFEGSGGFVTKASDVDPKTARCPNLARASNSSARSYLTSLETGRLYASEVEALRMQTALADPKQQGMIHFRLREDGHVTPLRITFRPRTAAELKAIEDAEKAVLDASQTAIDGAQEPERAPVEPQGR